MIRLGMHADNMRTISQSLQDAVKLGKKYGLEFTESGFVQGNYYVQWMGFEPSVSMLQNPIAIRKMCEEAGLPYSMLDCSFPMFSYEGAYYGVEYMQQGMMYAKLLGCTKIASTDSAVKDPSLSLDEIWKVTLRNYSAVLKWAEDFDMIVCVEPHGELTNDVEFMYKLLSHFESEHLRLNMDTGNTFIAGNDPLEFLKPLRKYLVHSHIKDVSAELAAASRGEETGIACSDQYIGAGVNAENIKKIIAYLKETNWSGDLSIECCGTEENIKKSVEWLRALL